MLALARALGQRCPPGATILLDGGMGAGKTTFTRGLAEGLGVHEASEVKSPTYTVCMEHSGPVPLVHVDLFRMGEAGAMGELSAAFEALGLEELVLGDPGVVTVVEWAERWNEPPTNALRLRLERPEGETEGRQLVVVAEASWARGWPEDVEVGL